MSIDEWASAISKRVSGPLFAGFALAWLTINYRLLVVLAGDGLYKDKFAYIDTVLYPNGSWSTIGRLLLEPLGFALFYIACNPFVDSAIAWYQAWHANRRAKQLLALERKVPISQEQQAAYFARYDEELDRHRNALTTASNHTQAVAATYRKELASLRIRLNRYGLRALTKADVDTDCSEVVAYLDLNGPLPSRESLARFPLLDDIADFIRRVETRGVMSDGTIAGQSGDLTASFGANWGDAFDALESLGLIRSIGHSDSSDPYAFLYPANSLRAQRLVALAEQRTPPEV